MRRMLLLAAALLLAGCDDVRLAYEPPSPLTDCQRVMLLQPLSTPPVRLLVRDGLGSRRWREEPLPDGDAEIATVRYRLGHAQYVMQECPLAWWRPDESYKHWHPDTVLSPCLADEPPAGDTYWWRHTLAGWYWPWATETAGGWRLWITLDLGATKPDLSDWPFLGPPWRFGVYDRYTGTVDLHWCSDVEITDLGDAELSSITLQFARAAHALGAGVPIWIAVPDPYYKNTYHEPYRGNTGD